MTSALEQALLRMAEIQAQYSSFAAQALAQFNEAQSRLALDGMLDVLRLKEKPFREEVIQKLNTVESLFEDYKALYSDYMQAINRESLDALAPVSDEEKEPIVRGMAGDLERELTVQSRFYAARERWILNSRKLCELVSRYSDSLYLEGEEIVCTDNEALEQFSAVLAAIDQSVEEERTIMSARVARLSQALG